MKNKILNTLIALALFIFCSCNKQLDTKPTSSIDVDDVFNTSDDVIGALKGSYDDLGDGDFYGGQLFVGADLLGDSGQLSWSGTFEQFTQIHNKLILVNNAFVADTWLAGYKAINDVNNVLAHLDLVTDAEKDRVEGEAKFIRGSVYFDLVRMYAKAWNDGDPDDNEGVPLVLTPTTLISDSSKVKRNTVAEVYAQAISDLTDATEKCTESDNTYIYATNIAAYAMLARVYLQQQDYANALLAENNAITLAEDNGYQLTSTYAAAFPSADPPAYIPNTTEDIFAMQVTATSGVNEFNTYYSENQRGDIQIEDSFFDLYEADDDRQNLYDGEYTLKFENYYGNVRLIRLAELYLTRAECNFRLGSAVGAKPVDDINTVRERANLEDYRAAQLTLDKILLERALELSFEGFTLHDEKRLEKNVGILPWNSPKLIYPIPQREIYANSNLTQNEGY
ncbi:RagB/SusD family nutrient uptake outer membrane protein [Parafilimonas sp.]|uniref:RagB/SusD family nutrient uptake outer membrane protein n=1 Tax=Parafilimonas sp. TaxID=1969739 RepID=UPI0039E71E57